MTSRNDRMPDVVDGALPHERTALSWDRTGLALIVAGALFVRLGRPPYHELRHAPGVLAMVFGAVLIVLASRQYEGRHRGLRAGRPVISPRMVVATGVFTVAFALAALVLIIWGD